MRHLDFLQRQLDERVGFRSCWRWWRHTTNPTKNQKSNCKNRETCWQLCASVCWTFGSRQRRRSCKNEETRWKWTIHRFVHTTRGHRHRLQSVWIATCSCETSRKLPCSQTRKEDRESSSSRSTSSRFAAKQRLQPIQWRIRSDDSWNGQCRVIRIMRNNSKSAMLRMPSLLESRNSLLHVWTSLEGKQIQPKFSPLPTGCFLNPALLVVVLRTAKLTHRRSNSKLGGPRRSASRWISWHRKTTPTAHPLRIREISEKLVYLT